MEEILYTALKEISIGNNPGTRLSSADMVLIAKIACGLYEAAQQAREGRAATESGLYNCQVCGLEKCRQPGICDDCTSPKEL